MKRIAVATILTLATGLAAAPPASAVPPERVVSEVYDADLVEEDVFLTEACGFPVTAQLSGHFRITAFFNKDGSLNRYTAHPSFRTTLSSPTATITTADVGLDRYVVNDDGTISVFGTGIHLKLKDGPKAIGLWRLVVDSETGELISEEYHGRFDVTADGTLEAVCDALS